jgi:hypothetical protein
LPTPGMNPERIDVASQGVLSGSNEFKCCSFLETDEPGNNGSRCASGGFFGSQSARSGGIFEKTSQTDSQAEFKAF